MTNRTAIGLILPFLLASIIQAVLPGTTLAQELTGTLIGTVRDTQSGVVRGATVRVSSPALIGGTATVRTNDRGQLRIAALPPGPYVLDIEFDGFTTYHEEGIGIGVNGTIERVVTLRPRAIAESVVVEGIGARIDARDSGFATRFGAEDLRSIPTRRSSMDFIRATPGISPTSPSSGTVNTVSAFGSGTNENLFLLDGTNFTCPCNGVARSEPGVDFIQEIHVQSAGASAEFGNVQGAVISVVTRQGSDRFLYGASYYAQTAGLTSQPVRLPVPGAGPLESGYERARYRDFSTSLGGPVVRDRLWFFTGYQYLRDHDSQPGSDPRSPRKYQQDKILAKLTWRLAPGWQLMQSVHKEDWVSPEQPTLAKPFDATFRRTASVPAMTFGHITHTWSSDTVWDARVGRFAYTQNDEPSSGDRSRAGRIDSVTGASSGAPPLFGGPTITRTTAKGTLTHYRPAMWSADHQMKAGGQLERGTQHSTVIIPTGQRFVDVRGQRFEMISSPPSHIGGVVINASAFASDAITIGGRVTINAGVRFDHSRAISQDLHAIDADGRELESVIDGLGTLYVWNILSPRLGVTAKLTEDGRTILRASYGRFSQGVMTAEIQPFHPGATAITTTTFDPATGGYTGPSRVVDPRINVRLDPDTQSPRTDEASIGLDREIGRRVAVAVAYVRKDGSDFIGWTDIGGRYRNATRQLPDGRLLPVFELENQSADRLFLLSNPDGYTLKYNGLVMAAEKRRSHGWHLFGSYTWSKAYGLQPASGTNAAGAQVSTVAPPPAPAGLTFGRDPNDLTNALGRLPNDRPHVARLTGSVEVYKTGFVIAGNLQHFTGKPWAATAQVALPQGNQRVLLEPRGSRRLSSQSLVDLRISRTLRIGGMGSIDLMVDVLNALNDDAEEALATDNLSSGANFPQPTVFIDPRRVMLSVRMNLGR